MGVSVRFDLVFLVCIVYLTFFLFGAFTNSVGVITGGPVGNGTRQSSKCPAGDVLCNSGLACIHKSWLCDGHRDCLDGSDELNCTETCRSTQFRCDQTRCIPLVFRCDGLRDCLDATDEDPKVCPQATGCLNYDFRCSNGECIPTSWKCDGTSDCLRGEDENITICANMTKCPVREKACKNHRCISDALWCDGKSDCSDHSDELNCTISIGNETSTTAKCSYDHFRCNDGRCIPERWLCDGWQDCVDSSDENRPECGPEKSTGVNLVSQWYTNFKKNLLLSTTSTTTQPAPRNPIDDLKYWGTMN